MRIGERVAVAVLLGATSALAGPLPRRYSEDIHGTRLIVFRHNQRHSNKTATKTERPGSVLTRLTTDRFGAS